MPKRKKAKHNHNHNHNHHQNQDTNSGLSYNEIWDDSALINSWNAALEEYQLYHSLAAKRVSGEE